eukprot:CAMPEP_0113611520 /NCGR_PEP_ID=MMETSP0017_2-20120614/5600_1 /TAXON_ID=2856 /ORGANISM="Cylindrotheca closterium" /LENGTH=1077 /DNA_ID=CAMNT_0000520473 /DNA_START=45 /DNA_END=3278 /DNA_ORIENTATION=- /assembly_acc=CAM_ASM_000147
MESQYSGMSDYSSEMYETELSSNSFAVRKSSTPSASFRPIQKPSMRSHEAVQELTINKLRYESIGLVGREKETKTLKSRLRRLVDGHNKDGGMKKELIFLKGYSGAGKSKLADSLERTVKKTQNGIFVRGKFDLNNKDKPYSGIVEAFGAICQKIARRLQSKKNKEGNLSDIGNEILAKLGSSAQLLVSLIPELEAILPVSDEGSLGDVSESNDYQAEQERFKYLFRVLTQVLTSHCSPLVLVLDDLQWADLSSMEVIDTLISDPQNSNPFMVIGCFRSNEVDESHVLSMQMKDWSGKKEKYGFNMTDIEVGSFGVDSVNQIIMAMLRIDDADITQRLAEICFKRTHGNPFFLIQFVAMLEETELLTFNLGLLKWVWDEEVIENETMSTSNVVDLLQARMRKLPMKMQQLLQYASCLESTFKISTLGLILKNHAIPGSKTEPEEDVLTLLPKLVLGQYFERCGVGMYRWVHDKVQEAALSLGDASTSLFQFEIGSILYHSLEARELEEALFVVVDLISKGGLQRRSEFAELNLRAAEKARTMSAFRSAAAFSSKGISLLPRDTWTTDRSLTLRLYSMGCEMELALGRHEVMEKYCSEVLSQPGLSTLEKLPIYFTKFQKLCTIDSKYEETIDLCCDVLKELGCRVPRGTSSPIKVMSLLFRTYRKAKKTPKASFETPRLMKDPTQKAIMGFLYRLYITSIYNSSALRIVFSLCHQIELTLKYGAHDFSGSAYAMLGAVAATLGDFETGAYFAEMGLLIQQSVASKYTESLTLCSAYSSVLAWTKPWQSCLSPMKKGYVCGMSSGNVEMALSSAMNYYCSFPYLMGKPLTSIETHCGQLVSQAEEVKQSDTAIIGRMLWQSYLNYMGRSMETVRLKGTAFDCDTFASDVPLVGAWRQAIDSDLLLFFGEFELAAELAIQRGEGYKKVVLSWFLVMMETFQRGVALYAMARRTKKRLYKSHARKILGTIQGWIKKGNPNVHHYDWLLRAEEAALDKKNHATADEMYNKAIVYTARAGHLHHAALFNERYSDFLLQNGPYYAEDKAQYRLEQAIHYYQEWGAEAKVELLKKKLSEGMNAR